MVKKAPPPSGTPEHSPYVVGVAGGSCSGKTHFCHQLLTSLEAAGLSCAVVSLDSFYLDRSGIDAQTRWQLNFDHPDALDWPELSQFIADLTGAKGSLSLPQYDFASHSRLPDRKPLAGADVYLVEGLYALLPRIELPYQLSIFIDCYESLTLYRRLSRDGASRGRSEEQILSQYYENVLPMYIQHIHPTRHHADFIIEWQKVQPRVLAHLTHLIRSQLGS